MIGGKSWIIGLVISKDGEREVQAFGECAIYDLSASRKWKGFKSDILSEEELLKLRILSLHLPLLDSTYPIINKDTIALMKKQRLFQYSRAVL